MASVLVVNAGSSSVRLALADLDAAGPPRIQARARHERAGAMDRDRLETFLGSHRGGVTAVAHRVVHGGPGRLTTEAFDGAVEADVERASTLAPLHNPATLAWLRLCRTALPGVPPLAVFDSGFFADLPPVAATYALPAELSARWGLRRLGFHGLAHRSLWQTFAHRRPARAGRVVSFQLGSGCSAAALRGGRPVDTSMGFTPLEGLVMATRCGDVDPGILLHLLEKEDLRPAELNRMLEERSGLAGVSHTSGDLRTLLDSQEPAARLAVDLFCYRARKYLGAYLAALGGGDAVLLGGGVSEKSPAIRERILGGLSDLGLVLDPARNAAAGDDGLLTSEASPIEAWVLPTDEETVIAEEAARWLSAGAR